MKEQTNDPGDTVFSESKKYLKKLILIEKKDLVEKSGVAGVTMIPDDYFKLLTRSTVSDDGVLHHAAELGK